MCVCLSVHVCASGYMCEEQMATFSAVPQAPSTVDFETVSHLPEEGQAGQAAWPGDLRDPRFLLLSIGIINGCHHTSF